MEEFYPLLFVGVVLYVLFFLVVAWVIWRSFRALVGIERGIWAVVSQLKIENSHHQSSGQVEQLIVDPAATRRAHEIANSAFGR